MTLSLLLLAWLHSLQFCLRLCQHAAHPSEKGRKTPSEQKVEIQTRTREGLETDRAGLAVMRGRGREEAKKREEANGGERPREECLVIKRAYFQDVNRTDSLRQSLKLLSLAFSSLGFSSILVPSYRFSSLLPAFFSSIRFPLLFVSCPSVLLFPPFPLCSFSSSRSLSPAHFNGCRQLGWCG